MALNEICKHDADLAQVVVDAGAVPYLCQEINHHEIQVRKQVCQTLSNIAKHTLDMAESIVAF